MSKKLTINNIRERSFKIHGDKYIITDQNYVDSFTKIKVTCKEHGDFYIEPRHFLSGHGCIKCAILKMGYNGKNGHINMNILKLTLDEIRKRTYKIHGDSIIIPEQKYINAKTKIKIICKHHPDDNLLISTDNLLNKKRGCSICSKRQKLNIDKIRKRCDIIHKDKGYIILEQPYINNETHIKVICPKHDEWNIKPNNLLNGSGCPKCKTSKGEIKIENILKEKNINYICQKKFNGCVDKKELLFDFYLPKYNMCIEYDGEQHYNKFRFEKNNDGLNDRIKKDIIKNEYCINNNIHLLRIKYNENIEEKMNIII